jgi:phosphatidylserine/phosphatidylglycerophosphate/cardiolipin synthase-like enzyme
MQKSRTFIVGNDFSKAFQVHFSMLSLQIKQIDSCASNMVPARIYSSTFIHHEDDFSERHLAYLAKAGQQGLSVKYLIDGFGADLSEKKLCALLAAGVDVRLFHPFPPTKWGLLSRILLGRKGFRQLFYRMHDKILVCGKEVKIGDRNISGGHYNIDEEPIMSREIYVSSGALSQKVATYYEDLFTSQKVQAWRRNKNSKISDSDITEIHEQWEDLYANTEEQLAQQTDFRSEAFACQPFRFLHKEPEKESEGSPIRSWLYEFLQGAESMIWIENAYITLPSELRTCLKTRLEDGGINIRLCTNSLATLDTVRLAAGWASEREKLHLFGIPIFERTHPGLMHCKTFLSDKQVAVGSANMNHRSLLGINHDVLLVSEDQKVMQAIKQDMANDFSTHYKQVENPKEGVDELVPARRNEIMRAKGFRRVCYFAHKYLTY